MSLSSKTLTFLIISLLTLGMIGTGMAAHSASSSLSPDIVDGDSTDDYSLEVTNQDGSTDQIYKVQVSAPSELTIDTSKISCPDEWSIDSSSQSSFTCYTDAFGGDTISAGSTPEGFDFSATSSTSDGSYTVDILTTDNSGASGTATDTVEIDNTRPESEAAVTDVSSVTDEGTWTVEAQNINDPSTNGVSSGVKEVTLQVKTPTGEWSDLDPKNYDGSAVSFQYSPGTKNGDYSFRTVAADNVDNQESVSGADTTVTYDTQSPSVTIDSPSTKVYRQSGGAVEVDFTYSESNPEEADVSIGSSSRTVSTLSSGEDQDATVAIDNLPSAGSTYDVTVEMTDRADNSGSDTVDQVVVVDDTAPTLDSATTGDSASGDSTARDKITLSLTESLSGIDSTTVESGDFTVSTEQDVKGATVNGETITLSLGNKLARDATPEVTVTEDSIEDMSGNQISKTTVTASDGISPQNPSGISFTQDSVNKDNDENIDVDVDFDSAPEKGDVTLRVDDSDSDGDALTFSESASDPTTFSAKDLTSLDDGTLTATAKIVDNSDNTNTNSEGFTASQEIQKDTTDPVLQNPDTESDTKFTFDVHDEGNGLDENTVQSQDFVLDNSDYSAESFSVDECEDGDATCTVTATLSEPIDQNTLTVRFSSDGQISDVEGNTQSSDTVQVSGMDGVAPTLDSAERVDDTTIEVTLSDSGVGLAESTVDQEDFSLSDGSISGIQTGFSDEANTGTVTINLESVVDSTSVDVDLQSDGVSDLNSNTPPTSGSATAENMDGVPPSITGATIDGDTPLSNGDQVTVYATVTDEGAGVDTVTADMSDFTGQSDVTLTSETSAEQDFDGDNDRNSDVYGATISLDETEATKGDQDATVEATDLANDQNTDTADTNSLEVDTTYPEVTSATITNGPISDSEAGDSQTVTVEFSEAMDTSDSPNVDITGIDQSPLDVSADGGFDSEGDTWTGTVTINDNEEDTTATIDVSGAQDQAGNSLESLKDNTFLVDTKDPQAPAAVDFDEDYVNIDNQDSVGYTANFDSEVEKGTLYVTATGSGDATVTDDVSLTAGDTSGSGTLDLSALDEDSVDIEAYVVDEYGNEGQITSNSGAAEKDTVRPQAPESAEASTIYENNVDGYSFDVSFTEAVETGTLEYKLVGSDSRTVTDSVQVDSSTETVSVLGEDVSSLADGAVDITARYVDEPGNYDSSSAEYNSLTTFTKDTVKPELDSATAVDRMTVMTYFDEELDSSTVDPDDFKVDGNVLADYQMVSDASGAGTATAEYAVTDDGDPAVHAHGSTNGDYATAGISFPVDTSFDGSNKIEVSYTEGASHEKDNGDSKLSPDWISYKVEDSSGDVYYIFDYGVDETSGTTVSWGDGDSFGDGSNEIVYDSNWDMASKSATDLKGSSTIKEVSVQTGSQGDSAEFDLYYTGVKFNGEEQLNSFVENSGMTNDDKYNVTLHLTDELATDATPEVEVAGEVEDVAGNTQSGVSVTADDEIAPEVVSATTFSDDAEADADGVEVKFTENLNSEVDGTTVSVGSSTDFTSSVSGDTLTLEFDEGVFGTAARPTVDVDSGAVGDSSSGTDNLAAAVQAADGVSPVLKHAEINHDQSSSSETVIDLTFSEAVSTDSESTATFQNAVGGELQFASQTGETVQGTYHNDSATVLNTGAIYDGDTTGAPEIVSFNGVVDESDNPETAVNSQNEVVRTFTRTLDPGYNLVSFPVVEGEVSGDSVVGGVDKVNSIWSYEDGSWTEHTDESEDVESGGLVGGKGYIFNMDDQSELVVNADHEYSSEPQNEPASIELNSGWNLVGSFQEYDQTSSEALNSVSGDYDVYNGDLDCADNVNTGFAYWVTSNGDGTYTPAPDCS